MGRNISNNWYKLVQLKNYRRLRNTNLTEIKNYLLVTQKKVKQNDPKISKLTYDLIIDKENKILIKK